MCGPPAVRRRFGPRPPKGVRSQGMCGLRSSTACRGWRTGHHATGPAHCRKAQPRLLIHWSPAPAPSGGEIGARLSTAGRLPAHNRLGGARSRRLRCPLTTAVAATSSPPPSCQRGADGHRPRPDRPIGRQGLGGSHQATTRSGRTVDEHDRSRDAGRRGAPRRRRAAGTPPSPGTAFLSPPRHVWQIARSASAGDNYCSRFVAVTSRYSAS